MEFCDGFAGIEDLYIPKYYDSDKSSTKGLIKGLTKGSIEEQDSSFEQIEEFLKILPEGHYVIKDNVDDKGYSLKKYYTDEVPVVEIEPLKDSLPLKRDQIPYGIRGFCFPAIGASYVHMDDVDTYRVNYHENLHMRIYRQNPDHPEWEIRMLEDWRLGEEKRY